MKQLILTKFPWPVLPMIALVIFFTFFVLQLIRVSMKSQQPAFERASELPLEEGVKHDGAQNV